MGRPVVGLDRGSTIMACCRARPTSARASAAPNATRTPSRSPHAAMQSPPKMGPSAIGMRLTSEYMLAPMIRLPAGSTRTISPMVAGKDTDDHEMNSTAPTITACQNGNRMTIRNPAMATRLNRTSARRVPRRSER